MPEHAHDDAQATYVIAGALRFRTGERRQGRDQASPAERRAGRASRKPNFF